MPHAQQPERVDRAPNAPVSPGVSPGSDTPVAAAPSAPVRRRFGAVQIGVCVLFFAEGLLGLFVVGWPALSLCILGTWYMAKVAQRDDAHPHRSKT